MFKTRKGRAGKKGTTHLISLRSVLFVEVGEFLSSRNEEEESKRRGSTYGKKKIRKSKFPINDLNRKKEKQGHESPDV